MKAKYLLLTAVAGALFYGLSACISESIEPCPDEGGQHPVSFMSGKIGPQTRTQDGGDFWSLGDLIGIYMFEEGDDINTPLHENFSYRATVDAAANVPFERVNEDMFYITNPVSFISYYPYQAGLQNPDPEITVDISAQTAEGMDAVDVLYSDDATGKNYIDATTPVVLTFNHQLSKLRFRVWSGEPTDDLSAMTVKLSNLPVTAAIALKDARLTAGATGAGAFEINRAALPTQTPDTALFEGIILPQAKGEYQGIATFEDQGQRYVWAIPDTIAYEKGKIYTYELNIIGQAVVQINSTIVPWNENDSDFRIYEDKAAAMRNPSSSINQKQQRP
jgi:hypothetical protein